jgi:hypothetical protein
MMRRQNFLTTTNNPTDMAIIGAEGRAEVLRAVADELSLSTGEIVPDKSVLQRRAREQMKQQQLAEEQALAGGVAVDGDGQPLPPQPDSGPAAGTGNKPQITQGRGERQQ